MLLVPQAWKLFKTLVFDKKDNVFISQPWNLSENLIFLIKKIMFLGLEAVENLSVFDPPTCCSYTAGLEVVQNLNVVD